VIRIDAGVHTTETEVIVGGAVTVTVALPDFVLSCVDVAVTVAVPALAGVKTPEVLTVPMLVGPTVPETNELKLPVPVTMDAQADVCVVGMVVGEQPTDTDEIGEGATTDTVADPDLVASCVEVAVIVAVPTTAGVKTPALLTEPTLVGVTVHATDEL
jgi:hypothetical protein